MEAKHRGSICGISFLIQLTEIGHHFKLLICTLVSVHDHVHAGCVYVYVLCVCVCKPTSNLRCHSVECYLPLVLETESLTGLEVTE